MARRAADAFGTILIHSNLRLMNRALVLLIASVVGIAFLLPACSKRGTASTHPGIVAENGMLELASVYQFIAANNEPTPRQLADLNDYMESLPVAYPKIERGEYVVFWGVGLNRNAGNVVLAHEKDAANAGGLVLMQDGTVKTLSAAEFQSAAKAR
jgi:hypothetical protein